MYEKHCKRDIFYQAIFSVNNVALPYDQKCLMAERLFSVSIYLEITDWPIIVQLQTQIQNFNLKSVVFLTRYYNYFQWIDLTTTAKAKGD